MLWTVIGIGGIWIAVVLISLLPRTSCRDRNKSTCRRPPSPRGSGGGVGTLAFLWAMGKLRGSATWRPTWIGLSIVTLVVWTTATVIGIATPVVETGSDPTRIPVGAFFGSVAAAMLTAMAGVVANVFRRGPGGE